MVYVAKERLHLAKDGKTVVPPGDPRSSSLLINEGGIMSDEDAKKYGLLIEKEGNDALPLGAEQTEMTLGGNKAPETPSTVAPFHAPTTPVVPPAPQHLRFGGQPQVVVPVQGNPPSVNITGVEDLPPPSPPNVLDNTEVSQPNNTPPPLTTEELPDDFPYKGILMDDKNFSTRSAVKAATKEQLLAVKQIGSERADTIMAAAEKL